MVVLDLCCCAEASLVTVSRGYSLASLSGLLIAGASLVVEHGLWGSRASVVGRGVQGLECTVFSSCGTQA